MSGWEPAEHTIIYSTTGYAINSPKTALAHANSCKQWKQFQLINSVSKEVAYEGALKQEQTTIGKFGVMDFTDFNQPGDYQLKVGKNITPAFRIGEKLWDNSLWKVLNFLFCQRCGHPVPGKHAACHTDLFSRHDGKSIAYSGGWHDAGDLSQQTLQTGDVTFSLLENIQPAQTRNTPLAARLLEEAEWGIEFILKNRYGDGYRASSMGLLIWQDGILNTLDDIHSVRVQNMAFDNFLYAGYEAYAAMTIDRDPMLQEHLRKVAEEDFAFATEKFEREGFDLFKQMYDIATTPPRANIWQPYPGLPVCSTSSRARHIMPKRLPRPFDMYLPASVRSLYRIRKKPADSSIGISLENPSYTISINHANKSTCRQ